MNGANQFPLPGGVTISFVPGPSLAMHPSWSFISGLWYTKNFTLADRGMWVITINVSDNGLSNDQIVFNSTTGLVGKHGGGTNTALITMSVSGYYPFANPPGGGTYNFSTVNPIKTAALTFTSSGVMGPS